MLRVRAQTAMVVGDPPITYSFGDEFEWPEHEAKAHLLAGHVERVERLAPVLETAVVENRGERATRFTRPAR